MQCDLRILIRTYSLMGCLVLCFDHPAAHADGSWPTFTDPATAGADYLLQGEYSGECSINGKAVKRGMQIIALGDGKFGVVSYVGGLPGDGWDQKASPQRSEVQANGGAITFDCELGQCKLARGAIDVSGAGGEKLGRLRRLQRKS